MRTFRILTHPYYISSLQEVTLRGYTDNKPRNTITVREKEQFIAARISIDGLVKDYVLMFDGYKCISCRSNLAKLYFLIEDKVHDTDNMAWLKSIIKSLNEQNSKTFKVII